MRNKTNEAKRRQEADAIRKIDLDYMAKHRSNAKARERFLRPAYQTVKPHKTVDEYLREKGLIGSG